MKILFCVRHNFYSSPGGAQIQILKTKEYLEHLDVKCDITLTPYGIDYSKYDILHLTDLTWVHDNIVYLKEIDKHNFLGKKILSTIYWPFDDFASNGAPFLYKLMFNIFGINGLEFAKSFAKFAIRQETIYLNGLKKSYIQNQIDIVNSVDWLLPNAESEMKALNNRLGMSQKNYSVANNAIDTKIFDEIIKNEKIIKDNNTITFVARIDSRKNQITFLKAMMHTDYTIKFIGNAGPNSKKYFEQLKKLAIKRGKVEFISHIPQKEVFRHMLSAKVNVLTSWIETPGLVSLEAAYAGCNIVVSDKGSVRDYFRNFAYYCNPKDEIDIQRQVDRAMKSSFNESVRKLIKEEYSWKNTAHQTYKAYNNILGTNI
jgi:glycosyltransferase involved in cell wall biosynthesis